MNHKIFDQAVWKEVEGFRRHRDDGLPYATHTGILKLGDLNLECVQLNTGQRLFCGKAVEDLIAALLST